jgi:cellobiose phosphorylase
MCSKPKVPKPDTRLQEQSLQLQREQMEMARMSQMQQAAMAAQNMRMASAPPAPKPNETAQVAALALDTGARASQGGTGRRKLRTDRAPAAALLIPVG